MIYWQGINIDDWRCRNRQYKIHHFVSILPIIPQVNSTLVLQPGQTISQHTVISIQMTVGWARKTINHLVRYTVYTHNRLTFITEILTQ